MRSRPILSVLQTYKWWETFHLEFLFLPKACHRVSSRQLHCKTRSTSFRAVRCRLQYINNSFSADVHQTAFVSKMTPPLQKEQKKFKEAECTSCLLNSYLHNNSSSGSEVIFEAPAWTALWNTRGWIHKKNPKTKLKKQIKHMHTQFQHVNALYL